LGYRDPAGIYGRDGYYYISGLHQPGFHGDNIHLVRGKDLTGAEPWEVFHLKGFETIQKLPWYAPVKEDGSNKDPFGGGIFKVGLCKPFEADGTFWVSLGAWGESWTFRSSSGTMEGPWEIPAYGAKVDQKRIGFWGSHPIQAYNGEMYGYLSKFLWGVNKDFTALDKNRKPPTEAGYEAPYEARVEGYYRLSSDGSALLRGDAPIGHPFKVDGKYMMMGGCGWHGSYRAFGTYDSCVFWAHEIGGPWHPNRSVLPHSGNSGIFQDKDGGWWNVVFANDNFLPDTSRLHCLPIDIKWNGNGYDIGPRHKQETPYVHREPAIVATAQPSRGEAPYAPVTLPAEIALQAPAITAVEDGGKTVYYLTGTPASHKSDPSDDFLSNDGLYLWKSEDLKTWAPLGKVFDLAALNPSDNTRKASSWNNPLLVYFSPPDSLEPRYDRGILTPKLYKIGADWWVLFSAGRQQVGLLKSKSGKPEGPYDLEGPTAVHNSTAAILDSGFHDSRTDGYMFAYDPSIFVEEDSSVYLVFGPGWIAKMQPDPGKGLAEKPRLIEIEGGLYAGKGGCQIFKREGKYHLLAANEWGDVIERTAEALQGPYRGAKLAFAQATASVFRDGKGQMKAVVATAVQGKAKAGTKPSEE
jgi:beta-xylosidase